MAEKNMPGTADKNSCIREAVCINTRKIFDSCKDKDCVEDLRVYPTISGQSIIERVISIRPKSAELLYVDVKVEPVSFKRGNYTVDCTYFYKLVGECFPGGELVQGLTVFHKRVMLFGSEGKVRNFSSCDESKHCQCDMPVATINAVDPIALSMRLSDESCCGGCDGDMGQIPSFIASAFPEELVTEERNRRWYATLGQFSIIMLERNTQLLIPAYDYCLPDKDCPGSGDDDPCELFGRIRFPVEEFFPPDEVCSCEEYRGLLEKK